MILRSFYNGAFSIASKHDFDDQFFLLAIVQRPTAAPVTVTNNDKNGGKKIGSYDG
jgi:hypothetical protein